MWFSKGEKLTKVKTIFLKGSIRWQIELCLVYLTFIESKQAITLPFSTWQLFDGWANLHSSSLREQFPRWNCRQTSRVSHFVSLTEEMFNAMSENYTHKGASFLKSILLPCASHAKSCMVPSLLIKLSLLMLVTKGLRLNCPALVLNIGLRESKSRRCPWTMDQIRAPYRRHTLFVIWKAKTTCILHIIMASKSTALKWWYH